MELKVVYTGLDDKPVGYAHDGDAGIDLYAVEGQCLRPGMRAIIKTGLKAAIPEGYVGLISMRSGTAWKKGIMVVNAPGIIDSGYRGEIGVIVCNIDDSMQRIEAGERFAQMTIVPYIHCDIVQVDELDDTDRGTGGYGSSGTE